MNDRELLEFIAAQVGNLTNEFTKIDARLTKIETTLETNVKPDIKLSLQGLIDTNEKLASIEDKVRWVKDKQNIDGIKIEVAKSKIEMMEVALDKTSKSLIEKIDTLSDKIERHDVEINVIKRVK
jgi:predicted  nucleic acid-binding Zn-ribbon protein